MADRPTRVESQEIDVTPEMIEAGTTAIRKLEWEVWDGLSIERNAALVTEIYRHMRRLDRRCERVEGGVHLDHQN